MRVRMVKWTQKETFTLVDIPGGITHSTSMVTKSWTLEEDKRLQRPSLEILVENKSRPGGVRAEGIALNPRIPEHVERTGADEDIISILVDLTTPLRSLKWLAFDS